MSKGGKDVEVECQILERRPLSILIRVGADDLTGQRDLWIPLSQVVDEFEEDGFIVVTRFIAQQESLE